MPTPSDDILPVIPTHDSHPQRSSHPSCPPDPERLPSWRSPDHCAVEDVITDAVAAAMADVPPDLTSSLAADIRSREGEESQQLATKTMASEEEAPNTDSLTPESMATDTKENDSQMSNTPLPPSPQIPTTSTSSSTDRYEFSNVRVGAQIRFIVVPW
jgi:hypothetical protein